MTDTLWNVRLEFARSPAFEVELVAPDPTTAKLKALRLAVESGWQEGTRFISAIPVRRREVPA